MLASSLTLLAPAIRISLATGATGSTAILLPPRDPRRNPSDAAEKIPYSHSELSSMHIYLFIGIKKRFSKRELFSSALCGMPFVRIADRSETSGYGR